MVPVASVKVLSLVPIEHSMAMPQVMGPLALVPLPIVVVIGPSPILLMSLPLASVPFSLRVHEEGALPMEHVVFELSIINVAVGEESHTSPISLAFLPHPMIDFSRLNTAFSISRLKALFEISYEEVPSLRINLDSQPTS